MGVGAAAVTLVRYQSYLDSFLQIQIPRPGLDIQNQIP